MVGNTNFVISWHSVFDKMFFNWSSFQLYFRSPNYWKRDQCVAKEVPSIPQQPCEHTCLFDCFCSRKDSEFWLDLLFISLSLEEIINLIWKNSHIYWKRYVHSHLLSSFISLAQVIWTCHSLSSSMRLLLFGTWVIAHTANPWSVTSGNNALQNWIKNIEAQQVVVGTCLCISGCGIHEVTWTPCGCGDVLTGVLTTFYLRGGGLKSQWHPIQEASEV